MTHADAPVSVPGCVIESVSKGVGSPIPRGVFPASIIPLAASVRWRVEGICRIQIDVRLERSSEALPEEWLLFFYVA